MTTYPTVLQNQNAPISFFEGIAKPLIERNWKVIPLVPRSKDPLTRLITQPIQQMSNDPDVIRAWGLAEPNANVGIYALKQPGGLVFLDKDGAANIVELYETETGRKFPETLFVQSSPNKGHFYFYQSPKTLELSNIKEEQTGGLFSLRLDNYYVAGIGSVHPKTGEPYRIVNDAPIVQIPDGLVAWLLTKVEKSESKSTPTENPENPKDKRLIPHGQIHGWMVSKIGGLYHKGLTEEEIEPVILRMVHENCEPPIDEKKVIAAVKSVCKLYKPGTDDTPFIGSATGGTVSASVGPLIVDSPDDDQIPTMEGDTFDPKTYDELAKRSTKYPDIGVADFVSKLSRDLVFGTSINLAHVREPLKAMVNHAIDGRVIHPAYPNLTLRGNYFSLGDSDTGKTVGLEFALDAGKIVADACKIRVESLFKYKSEVTFIRSFTAEGTIKRDRYGKILSGCPGHPSQFLIVKEGNLIANCTDYFASVFARLTDLYDQSDAGTSSMTNGDFQAQDVKASSVLCFTPEDFTKTFQGKGSIGGGGLNRWAIVNPPENHAYDGKDWERLDDSLIREVQSDLTERVIQIISGPQIVLIEEDEAKAIRLDTKLMLKKAGKIGKRLMDYFVREQVSQASMSINRPNVMTGEQARYARKWIEAQIQCRVDCWPPDTDNKVEAMEHGIRKAVTTHFVSERKLRTACNYYRQGSGGHWVFNTALKNVMLSGAVKHTAKTRKGVRAFCPGACALHSAVA